MKAKDAARELNEKWGHFNFDGRLANVTAARESGNQSMAQELLAQLETDVNEVEAHALTYLRFLMARGKTLREERKCKTDVSSIAVFKEIDLAWRSYYNRLSPNLQGILQKDSYRCALYVVSPILPRLIWPDWVLPSTFATPLTLDKKDTHGTD